MSEAPAGADQETATGTPVPLNQPAQEPWLQVGDGPSSAIALAGHASTMTAEATVATNALTSTLLRRSADCHGQAPCTEGHQREKCAREGRDPAVGPSIRDAGDRGRQERSDTVG